MLIYQITLIPSLCFTDPYDTCFLTKAFPSLTHPQAPASAGDVSFGLRLRQYGGHDPNNITYYSIPSLCVTEPYDTCFLTKAFPSLTHPQAPASAGDVSFGLRLRRRLISHHIG